MSVSFQDTGLTSNTQYFYRVRARAGDDYSGYSSIVSATTLSLFDLVLADGATIAFKFNESSGNILNYGSGGSAYDLTQVSSTITRDVTGVSGPDVKAITTSSSNGSTPTYGHMQGVRSTLSGNQAVTLECILKVPLNATKTVVNMNSTDAGNTALELSVDSGTGALRAGIAVTGQPFTSSTLTTSGVNSAFKHVVATWNGSNWIGYYQGAQIFSTAIGGGGTGIFDGAATHGLAVGGFYNDGTVNCAGTFDFLGIYFGTILTPTQVSAHFALSGC